MIQVKRWIWLFYGLVFVCWWSKGPVCALEVPWATLGQGGWRSLRLDSLKFFESFEENFWEFCYQSTPKVGQLPWGVCGSVFGYVRWPCPLRKGKVCGWSPLRGAQNGGTSWLGHPPAHSLCLLEKWLVTANVLLSLEGIGDRFISSSTLWDFKFWKYFFLFPEGSNGSTPCEILLVNY